MKLSFHPPLVVAFFAQIAFGASVYEASFEEAREVYEGIFDAAIVERKICEEELARGVQKGTWNEAAQKEGVAWLEVSFDAASQMKAIKIDGSKVTLDPRWTYLKQRLEEHRGTTALNNPACIEFSQRIESLDHARSVAAMRMCEMAVPLAEEIWLNARTADELAPAVRAIDYVRRGARLQWGTYVSDPFGTVRPWIQPSNVTGPGAREDVVLTAIHFRSVMGIPKPFLFPDPDQDPAAFWEASLDWNALLTMKHRFVLRPQIANRFAELNARYRSKMDGVRQRLDKMILTNAPAAEFENALRNFPEKPIPAQVSNRIVSVSAFGPGTNLSYRDLMASRVPRRYAGTAYTAFAKWLDLRFAEESGNKEKLETAANGLQMAAKGFTPDVAAFVFRRLSEIRAVDSDDVKRKEKPGPSTGDPVKDLIAALAMRENEARLAEAWRGVVNEDAGPVSDLESRSSGLWVWIAVKPKDSAVISLREQATRQALASITKSPAPDKDTEPLVTRLVDAMEQALSTGAKAKARRLLRLDVASGILTYQQHLAFREVVELLPDPPDPALEQDKSAIERRLRALLSQATSPAAARFASEELKKVRR